MIRAALVALLVAAGPAPAAPDHGLIRNQTGLPLVFPLQVRTAPGRDYALILEDAETGERALSAYIEGGRFFRLLMPPGTYRLHFATGTGWVDGEALFGPETVYWDYPEPLTFETRGMATKRGHLIDLRGLFGTRAQAESEPLSLCPGPRLARRTAPDPEPPAERRTSIAPAPDVAYPLPPGPRDPGLDGAPELGLELGHTVPDIPLWRRLGPLDLPAPPRPTWRAETGGVQRLC